ncbi:MAG: acetylxylan esterase, partial [Planctomycetaceae bacterium]
WLATTVVQGLRQSRCKSKLESIPMRTHRLLLFTATVLHFTLPAWAIEPSELDAILKHAIIEPQVPLSQVQAYCETRVPRLPRIQSRLEWEQTARQLRRDILNKVVFRGVAAEWRQSKTRVEWFGELDGGPGYHIKKLRYEALPGLWIPAVLYVPDHLSGPVPVVLNVNGHERGKGKAADYKQLRCINQVKRGMLSLNPEWLGMGQLNTPEYSHYRMNQLDLCGTSGMAPFYLAMSRALDVLLSLEHADPKRVAVAGLSGGGWQTIFISALDTRVTLCNPVAGYSSFLTRIRNLSDLGDSEQTPCDLATIADYTHMTAMLAPRPTLLTFNVKDNCCFASAHALPPLLEAARPIYQLYGRKDHLQFHVNHDPGTHNFEQDNRQALYRLLHSQNFHDKSAFDAKEIPSASELKTFEQLQVPIPDGNATFQSLGVALSAPLPRQSRLPTTADSGKAWQMEQRNVLRQIVRAPTYVCRASQTQQDQQVGMTITRWQFQIGEAGRNADWTVPAVEFVPAVSRETVVVIGDRGRAELGKFVQQALSHQQRVIAVDPFYFGESRIPQRDFLFALLVTTVGQRPLGIQAEQLGAIARWVLEKRPQTSVAIWSVGPRCSTVALTAAALSPRAISSVRLHNALGSLKEVIEQELAMNTAPEQFCFGLLESFDILQLAALIAPRTLHFESPSQRVKLEMEPLRSFYQQLGGDFRLTSD